MYPLKFEPILKQTLWGGDKIIPFKHLNESLQNVGESWEVSAVEGSESVVANGPDKGLTLPEMVRKYKEELVGEANYARFGEKFPLLIKFIDAKLIFPSRCIPTTHWPSNATTALEKMKCGMSSLPIRAQSSSLVLPRKSHPKNIRNACTTELLPKYCRLATYSPAMSFMFLRDACMA